jgi:hypothetical protein
MASSKPKSQDSKHFKVNKFDKICPVTIKDLSFNIHSAPLHTGQIGVFYGEHAILKNPGSLAAVTATKVTDCNMIVVSPQDPGSYLFTFGFHAPPGCFGPEIDGSEMGNFSAPISGFIEKCRDIAKRVGLPVEMDVFIIGINVNPRRSTYLEKELSKIVHFSKIRTQILELPGYKKGSWSVGEMRFLGDQIITSQQEFTCIDIHFLTLERLEGKKIVHVEGKGENRGDNRTFFLDF